MWLYRKRASHGQERLCVFCYKHCETVDLFLDRCVKLQSRVSPTGLHWQSSCYEDGNLPFLPAVCRHFSSFPNWPEVQVYANADRKRHGWMGKFIYEHTYMYQLIYICCHGCQLCVGYVLYHKLPRHMMGGKQAIIYWVLGNRKQKPMFVEHLYPLFSWWHGSPGPWQLTSSCISSFWWWIFWQVQCNALKLLI